MRRGRPVAVESRARQRHMLQLLTEGRPWVDAADEARVKPATVLRLLDDPAFRQVAASLFVERAAA